MKKGILKEDDVAKIAITAKREKDAFDDYIVKKFIEKREERRVTNYVWRVWVLNQRCKRGL
jgi:hypothetical protein